MNFAVIGSGGREHSICFKLKQSPKIKRLICIPGNAGTKEIAENINININNFDENKVLNEYQIYNDYDFQGSTWAPHLLHKDLWEKVGGFSEEFFPGTGSDPDLNMKLWKEGVRIFKGVNNCKVYHFGSIVTR